MRRPTDQVRVQLNPLMPPTVLLLLFLLLFCTAVLERRPCSTATMVYVVEYYNVTTATDYVLLVHTVSASSFHIPTFKSTRFNYMPPTRMMCDAG